MNFYDELIEKIEKSINDGDYEDAKNVIYHELMMAYVPGAIEEQLKQFLDRIDSLSEPVSDSLSLDKIVDYLKNGDRDHQVAAANALDRLNLREHLDLVENYLTAEDKDDDAKTLIIASLIKQEISTELKLVKEGMEISFIPRYILPVEESDGFIAAQKYFDQYLFKNPSYYNLAIELFLKQAYRSLPINIDEDESSVMADNIIKHIYRLFDDQDGLKDYESLKEAN